jgi:hypothetical protein
MRRNGGLRERVLHVECSPAPMFDPRMPIAHQPRTLRYTPAGIGCTPRFERRAGIRCGPPKAACPVLPPGRLAVRRLRVGAGDRGAVSELGSWCAANGSGACGATPPAQPRRAAPACGSSGAHRAAAESAARSRQPPDAMRSVSPGEDDVGSRRGEGVGGLIFKLRFDSATLASPRAKIPRF